MLNVNEDYLTRKVGNRLYFDFRCFGRMLAVWLICAAFAFFPLVLRPMFTKAATAIDAGYWKMVLGDNDVLYLAAAMSVIAVGMTVLMGRRSSALVYILAVAEVVAVFLATMGYLMLEGDPVVFGQNVYMINSRFLTAASLLTLVMFVSVNFRSKESVKKR